MSTQRLLFAACVIAAHVQVAQPSIKPLVEDATPDFFALSFGSLTVRS